MGSMRTTRPGRLVATSLLLASVAAAQSVLPVSALEFEGDGPRLAGSGWLLTGQKPSFLPYVTVDGHRAALGTPTIKGNHVKTPYGEADIAVDARGGASSGDIRGTLYFPSADGEELVAHAFSAPRTALVESEERYHGALAGHYLALAGLDVPGAPWFRRRAVAHGGDLENVSSFHGGRTYTGDDTFAMFTGGRALAESLRLDDVIEPEGDDPQMVPLGEIEGVRVPEMAFAELLREGETELDPLSALVPSDQYAVYFPSFSALVAVAERLAADAAPLVHFADRRAEDARVRQRYEAQMLLELDGLAKVAGAQLVRTAALTGADPYMRTGTDLALLFECKDEASAAVLRAGFEGRAAAAEGAAAVEVTTHGLDVKGWESADRSVSCWLGTLGHVLVVSNSREQVERIAAVHASRAPSMGSLDEYLWFRQRYPRADAEAGAEDAFVVVTDAAIRRWSGPRWRIATARRTRALAVLADAEAWRLEAPLEVVRSAEPEPETGVRGGGELDLSGPVARDTRLGARTFLNPILELAIDEVSTSERDGYRRWRNRFEAAWGGAFDPIAARISLGSTETRVDLTLVPLTLRSDYNDIAEFSGAARIHAGVPGPDDQAYVHIAVSLDGESEFGRFVDDATEEFLGVREPWLGDFMAFWIERDDEVLAFASEAGSLDEFWEEKLPEFPAAILIGARDDDGARRFVDGLMDFIGSQEFVGFDVELDSTDGVEWYGMRPVEASGFFAETPTVYVCAVGPGVLLTLSRKVLDRTIRRRDAFPAAPDEWIGRSAALHVDDTAKEFLAIHGVGKAFATRLRSRAFGNLPLLNEWRGRGIPDPVAFHEQSWGVRLVCPGGQGYRWDAARGTMESVTYGSPAAPRGGMTLPPALEALTAASFALEFERFEGLLPERRVRDEGRPRERSLLGLRAVAILRR